MITGEDRRGGGLEDSHAPARVRQSVDHSAARRARAAFAGALLLPSATGCYTYVPVRDGAPTARSEIALNISDQGRVALAERVGTGVRRVSGDLLQSTDSVFVLAVTSVEYLDAPAAARWSGEEVTIAREYVAGVWERRISRGRSAVAVALGIAAAVAVAAIAITGFGSDSGDPRPNGDGEPQ